MRRERLSRRAGFLIASSSFSFVFFLTKKINKQKERLSVTELKG